MNKIAEALKTAGTFFVATVDGDQPRVRPFSSVCEFEGNAYLCTNNTKNCYAQMMANSRAELCGLNPDGTWVRIQCRLVRDNRDEARPPCWPTPPVPASCTPWATGSLRSCALRTPSAPSIPSQRRLK